MRLTKTIILTFIFLLFSYAQAQTPPEEYILGNNHVGSSIDNNDFNYMTGSRVTTGTSLLTVASISVYVGAVSPAPNNQYQVAIYTDNGGVPETRVANSLTGILAANSWNVLPVSVTLAANTSYWLMYNTNASDGNTNNLRYDYGSAGQGAYNAQPFGSWPVNFGTGTIYTNYFSIYASSSANPSPPPSPPPSTSVNLGFHPVIVDANGYILPWYSADLGESYDHIINLAWDFWINRPTCLNGVKHYLQHRIEESHITIGGDQLAMALSSWQLLYQYSGNQQVVDNMKLIADFYLDHGLSASNTQWPNLPFPANPDGDSPVTANFFNGDLIAGANFTQPDKAGSFGNELVTLYKMSGTEKYLTAAINIANTLSSKVTNGDATYSPLPYRVNVATSQVYDAYTANWSGTLRLFDGLIALNQGNILSYQSAKTAISTWLKTYPMANNQWGPFFEDISGWSNTEINADTLAWYILENPGWDTSWQQNARNILDWTEGFFGNPTWDSINWSQYGVLPINEQTAYTVPGNSHTSRHGSVEIIYAEKTGDMTRKASAIRQLNWATYMVNFDGRNQYPENATWYTDGYGDYVRHYLRAMAAAPELAPSNQNHLLRSSSVITAITYQSNQISYSTFDNSASEILKINFIPQQVTAGGVSLAQRIDLNQQGWIYDQASGVLKIRHDNAKDIYISGTAYSGAPGDINQDTQVNVLDVQACVNHILGIQDLGSRGDVNGDGNTDVLDVQLIVNIILGG